MIEKIEYKDYFEYRLNGVLHREDGPAYENANGDKFWYKDGAYHREDGPAVEYSDGDKEWYLNGVHHRDDGPAVEWHDAYKEWWVNGYHIYKIELDLARDYLNCVGQFLFKNYLILCFKRKNYYFYTVLRGYDWDVDGKIFYCSLEEIKSLL